jgi:2-polyprenyl-3-methyl-5-hydroxy-6-metoxy-1,4-benzoquinol methylase
MFDFVFIRSGPAIDDLRKRLDKFYTTSSTYFDYAESDKTIFYDMLLPEIRRMLSSLSRLEILEIGAGKTSFPLWIEKIGLRDKIRIALQDITPLNRGYLSQCCDQVWIGELASVEGQFDVILSTFVYEHLVDPRSNLDQIVARLRPGGLLYIVSPCYTLPGYIPPALRHLALWKQLACNAFLMGSAVIAKLTGEPNFWIVRQPALFSLGYRRDADAVHMVSKNDIALYLRNRCEPVRLQIPKARSLQQLIWLRLAMLIAAYRKTGAETAHE